jgi:hypothetical protein
MRLHRFLRAIYRPVGMSRRERLVSRVEGVLEEDRAVQSFDVQVRVDASMACTLPANLALPRSAWAHHPQWQNYQTREKGFTGFPLGAHTSFRTFSQEVIEMVAAIEEPLAHAVAKGSGQPPAFNFQLAAAETHWQRWMAAMNGGHARFEERRLFKYINARWAVSLDHLPEAHRGLEQREEDVVTAMAIASRTAHNSDAPLALKAGESQGGEGDGRQLVAAHEAVLTLLGALLELDTATITHLAEEEEVVVPLLLEWCKGAGDVQHWHAMNDLKGLCSCKSWFCEHRRLELGLPAISALAADAHGLSIR